MTFEGEVLAPAFILAVVVGGLAFVVTAFAVGTPRGMVDGTEVFLVAFFILVLWGVIRRRRRSQGESS